MTDMTDMTDTSNLKTSEILTLAYKHLWNGDFLAKQHEYSQYVCGAVDDALYELGIDNLSDDDGWHPYKGSRERLHDYMDLILAKTDSSFYKRHLMELGVPRNLTGNPEWMQLRRRELLCSIISHFESIND